jgi:hypothetical protein
MPFSILQTGAALQLLNAVGAVTDLTLPTNVTLRTDIPPRWTVFGHNAVLVNTPSQPLTIDGDGTVRLLTPRPPRIAPILSGVTAGTLTGTYRAKMTHVLNDVLGNVIAESDYSAISAPVTIASKLLRASSLDLSPDQITGRRLYRTTTNGAVYFQWVDLDGNVLADVQDDLSDAGLSLVAAPILGTPPLLTLIAEFRGRLWGVGSVAIDGVRYTEAGVQYAWPEDNYLPIPGLGADAFGVVALLPRREALGVGRRNLLAQITGTGSEDANGVPDFDVVILSKELGVESQESMQIFRDTAYFLWKDGVYAWNSSGLRCVSDGSTPKGQVRSWFATDDYFNRDRYPYAFAHIDPNRPCYRLFLASAGSTTIDTWVEYDLKDETWWGPHTTMLFAPTSAFYRTNSANRTIPIVGSAETVWAEQATRSDTASRLSVDLDLAIANGVTSPTVYAKTEETWPDRDVIYVPSFDAYTIPNMVVSPTLFATYQAADVDAETETTGAYDLSEATAAIAFRAIGKRHDLGASDQVKYFGQLSLHGKAQTDGTLAIQARVGTLTSAVTITQAYDMTKTRERLGRLGVGLHAQLEFSNDELGVDVELYGYDIDPVTLVGRR